MAETVAASAGRSYPFNFPRMSLHELPTDTRAAMLLRSNAHDARVIHVGLPSVEAAAALARRALARAPPHRAAAAQLGIFCTGSIT